MLDALPLAAVFLVFGVSALVVAVAGIRMTALADRLADRTGLGEAVMGWLLLGMVTSLSGTVVSVTSALGGHASLAYANGVGGIAAQTAFLAIADLTYRKANLEHASADVASLFQAALLLLMLSVPLIAFVTPAVSVLSVHPASIILILIYVAGAQTMRRIREAPMWRPIVTRETRHDVPEEAVGTRRDTIVLGLEFAGVALLVGAAGWSIALSGVRISDALGISQTAVGALMTAVVTSMPELVTTLAAVRRGAAQLAVGGIIGGNCFDMLFLSLSDAAYREGSLYHAIGAGDLFWLLVGLAMTALLLLGLIVRERRGVGGIGFESAGILAIYAGAISVQVATG